MIKNIKLNLIKTINHENNYLSKLLVNDIILNDNLKKIRNTCKLIEDNINYKPFLSYTINNIEYKIYNSNDINEFLNKIDFIEDKSKIVYNDMMESKI